MTGLPKRGGQRSWTLSILLHLAIAAVAVGLWYWAAHRPQPAQSLGIEARVVSNAELAKLTAAAKPPPEPEPPPQEQPQPEPEPTPAPDESEPPPPADDAAAQQAAADAEAARVAEERRLAEERLVAERKAADEAAATKAAADQAERERKQKEQAERDKAEKAKAEKAKADKEKADKEKAEQEQAARDKAEKDKADKARQQREDELSAQLAAEDRLAAARSSGLQNQYIAQITAKITRSWLRPPSAKVGLSCEVHVTQVPGGAVTGVTVGRCNGDEAVKQSIEAAVYRASPLPDPPDPSLFDRNLNITFAPDK